MQTRIDSLEEHYAILDALRSNDVQSLETLLTRNLQHGIEAIQQGYVMSRQGASGVAPGTDAVVLL
jgi:DNA-binding GntR family transcriptional regulator